MPLLSYESKEEFSNDFGLSNEETWEYYKKELIRVSENSRHLGILVFDIHKKAFLVCSKSIKAILGYSPSEFYENGWNFFEELIEPRHSGKISQKIKNFIFSKQRRKDDAIYLKYHLKAYSGGWRLVNHELYWYKLCDKPVIISYLYDFTEKDALTRYINKKSSFLCPEDNFDTEISPREWQVLKLIADGFSSKQIAAKLYISNHTAITHRKHLIAKFKANNTAQLIKKACKVIRL